MASKNQVAANQKNATSSTGPVSDEGKAQSAQNARKHGLFSEKVVIPGESKDELESLATRLREELCPVGALEELLADKLISLFWRLRRLCRVEAGVFAFEHYGELLDRANYVRDQRQSRYMDVLSEVRAGENILSRGVKKVHEETKGAIDVAQALRAGELPTLGRTFVRDAQGADAFSKLSRYETTLERSLQRTLHELQRIQAKRMGQQVAPPVAVDVTIDSAGN